jgi:uncharacterized protein (DUF433 family)
MRGARAPHIRDVVDVDELVQRFRHGATIRQLTQEYAISKSSVKRLLRAANRSE